jgi:ketosteroid isomerase-like protein
LASLAQDRAADKAAAEKTLRDYVSMYMTGDPKKIAAYLNDPLMFLPNGTVTSGAEAEESIIKFRDDLKSKGIVNIHLEQVEVKMLGANVALVSTSSKRQAKDGATVNTMGAIYLLRKSEAGWKIAAVSLHPVADFVKLD